MAAARRALLTGATGLLGRRLTFALQRGGWTVRALSRSEGSVQQRLGAAVEGLVWDGIHVPPEALEDVEAVVHLSGEPVFGGRLTRARKQQILSSRVDSARSLVDAMAARPPAGRPAVLVSASAVGFYGCRGEEVLDESAQPGQGFLANVCVQWEQAARAAEVLEVRVVFLRIRIVMAREGGALAKMAVPFRLRLGGRLGNGRQWFPWIHADDVVGLIEAALEDPSYNGPVNAVAPNPVRNAELTRVLAQQLDRPAILPAPALVIRLALGELADELLGSRRVHPGRALDAGFRFAHPTLEGALAEALSEPSGRTGSATPA